MLFQIPISFGNSCVGIFDHATAREATFRLFKAYGIELKKDVAVKGGGYEFSADGYNAEQKVGFELVMPQGGVGLSGQVFEKESDAEHLNDKEKKALSEHVAAHSLNVLVMDASGFPNMDGDLYTPMEYYLGSVVDYLNWLHGDKKIDPEKVLGKHPGRLQALHEQVSDWQKTYATLPGCGFESPDDLKFWSVQNGAVGLYAQLSGNLMRTFGSGKNPERLSSSKGKHSLQLHLQEGGKATYKVPEGTTIRLKPNNVAFACRSKLAYVWAQISFALASEV